MCNLVFARTATSPSGYELANPAFYAVRNGPHLAPCGGRIEFAFDMHRMDQSFVPRVRDR